jgi:hypothetical protein
MTSRPCVGGLGDHDVESYRQWLEDGGEILEKKNYATM